MLSISVLTALVAGLLVLISFAQPAADRLHLPYTVLLAIVGTAVASLASFLLYTPLTDVSLGRTRGRSGRAWSHASEAGEQVSWTQ